MDSKEIFSSGRNIKCYDKIKIVHQGTGWRLHANNKYYRQGSLNEVVSCHKARNDTDWFIVTSTDREINNPSHNIRNGDNIVLTHMQSKKNVHSSTAYESPVTKNAEVSLCMSSGPVACLEDTWKLELCKSRDDYWRVGQAFKLLHVQSKNLYLYTHKKKMDDFNGDFEVCCVEQKPVEVPLQGQPQPPAEDDSKSKDINPKYKEWLVCQIQPYIYTAPVSGENKPKIKTESEEYERLKEIKKTRESMKKKERQFEKNPTNNLIKYYDEVLANKKPPPKKSCWKRYFCCCCFSGEDPDEYYEHIAS